MVKTPFVKKSLNPRLPKVVNGDGVKTRSQSMTDNALKLTLTLESKDYFDQSDSNNENVPNEETTFQEKNWLDAINRELSNIERMNTWSICTIPKNVKALKTRWVFVKKPCSKYRARLVVKDFLQKDNKPDVILKYIKRSDDLKLECFSDASFAPCNTDLKSITGMACYLNNDLFYWSTKRQTKVARFIFVAKLFALVYSTDMLMHTGKYVKLFKPESKLILYTDNLSLFNSLKRDTGYSSKAVDIEIIYLKECLKKIKVMHVNSEEILADSLTKFLSRKINGCVYWQRESVE
uniref:Reverse transcriptase Ty1/copia-type domain-containing protein n=1 Tax=Strongyloides venezuelensis TaxID=75913 RepID=A0A0K0F256_STRVS